MSASRSKPNTQQRREIRRHRDTVRRTVDARIAELTGCRGGGRR